MIKQLLPGATIGIIGAGQLGKMMAQAAQKMGYRVAFYDPNPQSCGFSVAHWYQVASFDDEAALLEFVKQVDVVTYEFENINGPLLEQIAHEGYLPQGTSLLRNSQHRLLEKAWLSQIGIPVADYYAVECEQDLLAGLEALGYPAILKTARFGYDGKGQIRLHEPADLQHHAQEIQQMLQQTCVLEAFCKFDYEVSVMVARDGQGKVITFPVSENIHEAGILCFGIAPAAKASQAIQARVSELATKIAQAASLIGVCGIEFFVTAEGLILVNELAPRPHNSGHYTIEGTNISQYDAHVLAITGRQLPPVRLLSPTLMVNILGQHIDQLETAITTFPDAMFHVYNKGQAKAQRKMGHFIIYGDSAHSLTTQLSQSSYLQDWQAAFHMQQKN